MSQQPPSNPNQPPLQSQPGQSSPFWGNNPPQGYPPVPQQGQFPQGTYPPQQGYPQQGYPQQFPQSYPQQQYQQPPMMQPPTPPKKKRRGLLIAGIIAVVLVFGCIGASVLASHSATAVTTATTSSKVGNTTGTTPTAIPTQATNYKVGDVVNVGNTWDITVVSAKVDQGSDVFQPKSGMQYLVLNLAMKNLTTENHTISSLIQFTLRGDGGTKYNVALYAPDGTSQIDGDVDGGQPAKGVISYEVPTNVHSFHLTFENVLSAGRATWNLSV